MEYNFGEIERKWQQQWKDDKTYKVENDFTKPKCYVLDMFPYPSGAGLHVGHPLGYIASDIYSRYKRLKGFNVLHPMGFDSFGLPAEQYALETGQHPADTTEKNIATFKEQLDKIGFCYDWEREVRTSDPSYYKWTQTIFLKLFHSYFCNTQQKARPIEDLISKYESKGSAHFSAEEWNGFGEKTKADWLMKRRLAFVSYGEVNWCEALGTVLANDEVVNGVSERGGHPVEKKKMRQWYLRITAYADRLLSGLDTVQFSDSMKEMQRNWIGKSEGAEMSFAVSSGQGAVGSPDSYQELAEGKEQLAVKVYTTRPDTIFGVDFLVLAPEHELVEKITTAAQKVAISEYLSYVKSRSDRERMAEVKQITGCDTGAFAINPFNGKLIPIWIAEYVLSGYGTGAIMAVPCGDQRDFAFAKHFNIPITNIIGEHYNGEEANPTKEAILENSDFLNGLLMKDAIAVGLQKIEELGIGKRKVNYRMRDAGFSRQRYWGEPFPIVWENEIAKPLSDEDLPLELPFVDTYGPGPDGEGPLANIAGWVDLTPNPSPGEREIGQQLAAADDNRKGWEKSTVSEWRNTVGFARENRKNSTQAEDAMWQALRSRKLDGYKFRRQHPIAGFIPDFVCLVKRLIVEIDGGYHNDEEQKKVDTHRENVLKEAGFEMVRFTNEEVEKNINAVLQSISKKLSELPTINEVEEINEDSEQPEQQLSGVLNSGEQSEPTEHNPLPRRGAGGEVKRETSTMPGYAGSSWYFLRYMDPNNTETFCERKISDYWNQVDIYIGGTEHAVGHLLYSRMWTKVLYDLGYIGFEEPFKKLVNQGMITGTSYFIDLYQGFSEIIYANEAVKKKSGRIILTSRLPFIADISKKNLPEINGIKLYDCLFIMPFRLKNISEYITYENTLKMLIITKSNLTKYLEKVGQDFAGFSLENVSFETVSSIPELDSFIYVDLQVEKMSKSKFNTANPDDIVNKYGADTFRMYEMFLGPVEMSKPWDTKGIEGVHRFLRKLWRLFFDDVKGKVFTTEKATDAELKTLHKAIKKIDTDTENFSYNTAVSAFMVAVNELSELKCHKVEVLQPLLVLLAPYAPHIAEELWHATGGEGTVLDAAYPVLIESYLTEATKEFPISINGKLRTTITMPSDISAKEAEKMVLENEAVQKWLEGKAPKKLIFVKGRMVNVVL